VLREARRILCLSARQKDILVAEGVREERLQVASNFLPRDLDRGRSVISEDREGWIVAGRLSPEKGVAELVEQWPSDGPPLTVVGDGPERRAVLDGARGKPIRCVGPVERSHLVDLLCRAVGLVLPSMWFEVLPLVVIEALAAGARVLVTGRADLSGAGLFGAGVIRGPVECVRELGPASRAARDAFERSYSEGEFVLARRRVYEDVLAARCV
jgi:glycosyltransferase involved in cell wall biosynthesis